MAAYEEEAIAMIQRIDEMLERLTKADQESPAKLIEVSRS